MQRRTDGVGLIPAVSENTPMMHHLPSVHNGTTPAHALLTLETTMGLWRLDTFAETLKRACYRPLKCTLPKLSTESNWKAVILAPMQKHTG